MRTSEVKKQMRSAFGHPFTTKSKVKEAMGYTNYTEIKGWFEGLPRVKSRYFTDEVIERILGDITYEEE